MIKEPVCKCGRKTVLFDVCGQAMCPDCIAAKCTMLIKQTRGLVGTWREAGDEPGVEDQVLALALSSPTGLLELLPPIVKAEVKVYRAILQRCAAALAAIVGEEEQTDAG